MTERAEPGRAAGRWEAMDAEGETSGKAEGSTNGTLGRARAMHLQIWGSGH